jgi:quercetin dioxygenase-like cupin family protein
MSEFDDLAQFLEWWLVNRPINVPQNNAITQAGVIYGLVLYRQGPYQVQLFIMPPNSTIDDHIHPNVDSYEVYLGGDINFRFDGEMFAPEALGTHVRVKPNCWHGGLFGPRGGSFLSVQKWLNGKEPTTVGDDWHDASNNRYGAASLLKE